jgi:hypothetical protein
MVNLNTMVSDLRTWIGSLPGGAANIEEDRREHEHIIKLRPRDPRAAGITVSLGSDGTFEVFAGKAFRSGELPYDRDALLEACEAVSRGRMTEETWELFGRVLRARATIQKASGNWYNRKLGPPVGRHSHHSYAPWF